MSDYRIYAGVAFVPIPIVCEQHPCYDWTNVKEGQTILPSSVEKIMIGEGMVTERGLICPICYKVARPATAEELQELEKLASPQDTGAQP